MDLLTILTVALLVGTGFFCGTVWLFMRPGGVVEKLGQYKERKIENMILQIDIERGKITGLLQEMEVLKSAFEVLKSHVNSRMGSFESKYGKAAKAEERAALQQQIFSQMNPQVPAPGNAYYEKQNGET